MKFKIVLMSCILGSVAFSTGCASMPGPTDLTDAIGITHIKEDKAKKAEDEKIKNKQEHEDKCTTKINAWGEMPQNSRNTLWSKLNVEGTKYTRENSTFYSLPYLTFICPTREQLIGFEKMLSANGGRYTLMYDGTMTTQAVQGTQCKRLDFTYTAVGIKIEEFSQGNSKSIHILWDLEQIQSFSVREGWVSTGLNSWIIDYKESTKIMKGLQKKYREKYGLPDKPTEPYKNLVCRNTLHYQSRSHVG